MLTLYLVLRTGWLIWRMAEEVEVDGGWVLVTYWIYWILLTGLESAYLASLSFAIWCYAQMLRPGDEENAWPITAFAEAHQKLWHSLVFGIGLYIFTFVANLLFPYLMGWVYG